MNVHTIHKSLITGAAFDRALHALGLGVGNRRGGGGMGAFGLCRTARLRRFRPLVVVAFVVVAAGLTASVAPARDPAGGAPALQRALDELVAAGAPGVIALVRDGDRTFRLSSGYGNLATKAPFRSSDRVRIASLTKSFVATVVLQLVGEGTLSLDDTVERWLPGLIPNGDAITVRELLNHTSGIYDSQTDPKVLAPYLNGNFTHVTALHTLIQIAAAHRLLFAPGSKWSYSNTNYYLLGMIVKAATGDSIGSELRRRIFEPLRLRHTTFPTSPRIAGPHAHGYFLLNKPPLVDVTIFSPSLFSAAGAIVSTADDVARFYRALLSGRLLKPGLLKSMETIDRVTIDASGSGYGLGLSREGHLPCGDAWGHDGDVPGYLTIAFNSKDGSRQIVVVINSDSLTKRAHQALDKVLVTAYCRR
jgi:D-alanyl-D-alanine carboxypeptidase